MNALRTSDEYENGVEEFIEFSNRNATSKNVMYFCPCVKCINGIRQNINGISDHLICEGISLQYTKWICHGEKLNVYAAHERDFVDAVDEDRMERMIHDVEVESFAQFPVYESMRSDAETPLYPGSKHTRLTGTLHLMNLKASCGWTDNSFTLLLQLLGDMLPENNVLPNRMYEAKKILSTMGMKYKKIHACPNDCILYRNGYEDLSECPKCKTARYKVRKGGDCGNKLVKWQPLKVLWYLPIV